MEERKKKNGTSAVYVKMLGIPLMERKTKQNKKQENKNKTKKKHKNLLYVLGKKKTDA